jgi:hypothetical protein
MRKSCNLRYDNKKVTSRGSYKKSLLLDFREPGQADFPGTPVDQLCCPLQQAKALKNTSKAGPLGDRFPPGERHVPVLPESPFRQASQPLKSISEPGAPPSGNDSTSDKITKFSL